jgi:predicted DNA-binding transcriptional regulator YafY
MPRESRLHERVIPRLLRLDELIRNGHCISATQVGLELGVSRRTIERDLDLLRDRMGAPLVYDSTVRRWRYTESAFAVPAIKLTEGEVIAVFFADRLIRQYSGSPFEPHLRRAFEKIVMALPQQISVDLDTLGEAYSFEVGPVAGVDATVFEAIGRAATNHKTVSITYYSQERGAVTVREIDPYHVHNFRGDWYVIAFDHLRSDVRDFLLARIRSLTETQKSFEVREQFDLGAYMASGFAMIRGGKQYVVEIEFDEYQSRWIRERKKWHPTEEREELDGDRLLLRMKLGGLDAIQRFVLQYGRHARVLRPARLRKMVEREITAMAGNYF